MNDTTGTAAPQPAARSLSENFERWVVAVFPHFLERLSKLQPLALLFSLSIVVATFSRQTSQTAFFYGMAATLPLCIFPLASALAMFNSSAEPTVPSQPYVATFYGFVYRRA